MQAGSFATRTGSCRNQAPFARAIHRKRTSCFHFSGSEQSPTRAAERGHPQSFTDPRLIASVRGDRHKRWVAPTVLAAMENRMLASPRCRDARPERQTGRTRRSENPSRFDSQQLSCRTGWKPIPRQQPYFFDLIADCAAAKRAMGTR